MRLSQVVADDHRKSANGRWLAALAVLAALAALAALAVVALLRGRSRVHLSLGGRSGDAAGRAGPMYRSGASVLVSPRIHPSR
jgi:cobalamin synthase